MIWSTEDLPCSGIACSCDMKAVNRDKKIKGLLGENYKDPFYKGNHNLRAPDIIFNFSDDEKLEWVKCLKDINYFHYKTQSHKKNKSDKYGKILHVGKANLYKSQQDILSKIEKSNLNVIVNSRQSGMGYVLAIKALYKATMFEDKSVLIITYNNERTNILNYIKDMYQTLPFFLKRGIRDWNKNSIRFDNGSRIILGDTSHAFAANWSLVILDDYAYYDDKKMNDIYKVFLPVISSIVDSEMIICSIPNGDNHFKWIVEEDNFFEKHSIHWTDIPNRDESFKNDMIMQLGSVGQFAQEYENLFINTKQWNRFVNLESILKNQK